jgi:hypothetical protein
MVAKRKTPGKKAVKFLAAVKWTAIIFFFFSISNGSGCAPVSQLKRKNLSDPIMKLHYDQQEKSLNDHIFERREGSSGGSGGSGGGCGC